MANSGSASNPPPPVPRPNDTRTGGRAGGGLGLGSGAPPRPADPTNIAGRYDVVSPLGEGGYGRVYVAVDRLTGARVAVKVLQRRRLGGFRLFRREIALLRMLRLPGVVRFIDDGIHRGSPFLVTELVEGAPFPGDGALDWESLRGTAVALLEALDRVHAHGVVHRDIKPSNVIVGPRGAPILLDFGVSLPPRLRPDDYEGDTMGTPLYMAPEQMDGAAATAQGDLYGVGVMLFEALTGESAFPTGGGLSELAVAKRKELAADDMRDVPPSAVETILAMASPDLARRPGSAAEAAARLNSAGPSRTWAHPIPSLSGAPALDEAQLAALFHGPEVVFHLPSDAARVLHHRTAGDREHVQRELDAWTRAGLCFWREGRVAISRDAIEQLSAGLEVVRPARRVAGPESVTGELPGALASNGVVTPLAVAVTRTLPSVHAAMPITPIEDIDSALAARSRALVADARDARREGRHGQAGAWVDGGLALSRAARWVDGEREALCELTKLAIEKQSIEAIDLALYEIARSSLERVAEPGLEALLRAARSVRTGDPGGRIDTALNGVPTFDDPELERLRRAQMVLGSQLAPLEEHAAMADATLAWARETGDVALAATVEGWTGFLWYRRGDFQRSVDANLVAARQGDTPIARLSALSNAAMALVDACQFDQALELAREGARDAATLRSPFFELRFRRVAADVEYRAMRSEAVDELLVEAAIKFNSPTELAPLCLTQAAVAWRLGDRDRAAALAERSARSFGAQSLAAGVALASALRVAATESPDVGTAEADVRRAVGVPGVALQVAALHAMAGAPVAFDTTPYAPREARAEVLSPTECLRALTPQLPSSSPEGVPNA